MFKAPLIGSALAALLLGGPWAVPAAKAFNGFEGRRTDMAGVRMAVVTAWNGGTLSAGRQSVGQDGGQAPPRSALDLPGVTRNGEVVVDGAGADPADALPLSQFVGGEVRPTPSRSRFAVWDFVAHVRYGGLPEPASWALMLIGFGMIGGVLRGIVVANRRLAGLQPDQSE